MAVQDDTAYAWDALLSRLGEHQPHAKAHR